MRDLVKIFRGISNWRPEGIPNRMFGAAFYKQFHERIWSPEEIETDFHK